MSRLDCNFVASKPEVTNCEGVVCLIIALATFKPVAFKFSTHHRALPVDATSARCTESTCHTGRLCNVFGSFKSNRLAGTTSNIEEGAASRAASTGPT